MGAALSLTGLRPRSFKLSYKLQAIAAAEMPRSITILSSDPRLATHRGIVEVREYAGRRMVLLHDSLETRWRNPRAAGSAPPTSIALYRLA